MSGVGVCGGQSCELRAVKPRIGPTKQATTYICPQSIVNWIWCRWDADLAFSGHARASTSLRVEADFGARSSLFVELPDPANTRARLEANGLETGFESLLNCGESGCSGSDNERPSLCRNRVRHVFADKRVAAGNLCQPLTTRWLEYGMQRIQEPADQTRPTVAFSRRLPADVGDLA